MTRPSVKPPEEPPVAGLDSRRACLDILTLIRKGRSLDDALAACRSFGALEGSDRAFARALTATVLRRRGSLDHVIGGYLDRPLPKKATGVMDILRVASAQLLVMETPPHAAVSTATALAKEKRENEGYAALVNAVARKISQNGPAVIAKLPARTDTPGWLWRSWERSFGPAGARNIAAAHQKEPPLDLTPKTPALRDTLAEALDAKILSTGSLRLTGVQDVTTLHGFEDGDWWVQDAAAALPVQLLGDIAGKRVFDLCAAPGGKTMQLAAAGAEVVAIDKSEIRLGRVNENLSRAKLKAEAIAHDVLKWRTTEKADAILLDAPCSATGTIRRHPDIPWTKSETVIEALVALQEQMIDHALTLLKPGGTLVYCVCSLERAEGEDQAAAALSRHEGLTRMAIDPAEIGGLKEAINRHGDLRTLPSMLATDGGMDGFFAARFSFAP